MAVILSVLGRSLPNQFDLLLRFNPNTLSRYTGFLLGMGLIYMAFQIRRRKLVAFNLTLGLIAGIIIISLVHSLKNALPLMIYAPILALMYQKRSEFIVKSDATGWKRSSVVGASLLLAVAIFATLTFLIIDQRQFGRDISTGESFSITIDAVLGKPLPEFVRPTRQDKLLVELIQLSAIVSAGVVAYSIFSPVRFRQSAPSSQVQQAKLILQKYGGSTEDHFKLWPNDKHYFFYGDSFIAFGVNKRVAVALDGASGETSLFPELRRLFLEECHRNGWMVTILHADEQELIEWKKLGFHGLMIGSEAVIDVVEFAAETHRSKHFRYVKNKAVREGLSVELWQPPHSIARLEELKKVSDAWLQNGRREYTFAMGYFDGHYLSGCEVAVLKHVDDVVGYVNIIPSFETGSGSIDHMRYSEDTTGVGMHFLLMELVKHLGVQDIKHFNLGMVPLSQLETAPASITKSLLKLLKKYGNRVYSFTGLEQFKNKFSPDWQPRYIAFEGNETNLPEVVLAINRLLAHK